jgi:hypothetical protein
MNLISLLRINAYARLSFYFFVFAVAFVLMFPAMWQVSHVIAIFMIIMTIVSLYISFNIAYFRIYKSTKDQKS